jgi:hypothetical protein
MSDGGEVVTREEFRLIQKVIWGNGELGLKGNVEALMQWQRNEEETRKEERLERAEDRRNARSNRVALFIGVLGILATLGFTVYNTVHPPAQQTVYVERQTTHETQSNGDKLDTTTDTETKEGKNR